MLINLILTGKIIKNILKLTVVAIVISLTAALTVFSILRTPSFQEFAGRMASGILTKKLNHSIHLDKLRISDFFYIEIHGLNIKDHKGSDLLDVQDMHVKIDRISLRRHDVAFSLVSIDSGGFYLRKHEGDSLLNLKYFLQNFEPDSVLVEDTVPAAIWHITCENLLIESFALAFSNDTATEQPQGIDINHLSFSEIFLDLKEISITGDSIAAFIEHVACREKSGAELLNLSGDARVSNSGIRVKGAQVSTGRTSLDLDLAFLYNSYDQLSYFLDSVTIESEVKSSLMTIADIGYFAPQLLKMDDPVMFSGVFKGTVADFQGSGLSIELGDFTAFRGDISMKGLPEFDSTYIRLVIDELNTTPEDIAGFNLPLENPNIVLPEEIKRMGLTSINGYFEGYPTDFHVDLSVCSDAMNVAIAGDMQERMPEGIPYYKGDLQVTGADLGSLLNYDDLGTVDLTMRFDGSGSSFENLVLKLEGSVDNLEFRNYRYDTIKIDGLVTGKSYSGEVAFLDSTLDARFNGLVDFNGVFPHFDFDVQLNEAQLYRLNISDRYEDATLSGNVKVDFSGLGVDEFLGNIMVDSVVYYENGKTYKLNHLDLSKKHSPGNPDIFTLRSDYVDADMEGHFRIREMAGQIDAWLLSTKQTGIAVENMESDPQYVSIDMRLKNITPVTDLFLPGIEFSQGITLKGEFDSKNRHLELNGHVDKISFGGMIFDTIDFSGKTVANKLSLDIEMNKIILMKNEDNDDIGLENPEIHILLDKDTVLYAAQWDDGLPEHPNRGELDGYMHLSSMKSFEAGIRHAEANFGGEIWHVAENNRFTLDSSMISISDFQIFKGDENFMIDGKLSKKADDTLSLYFKNWELENFNPFLEGLSLQLSGKINGRFGIFRHEDITNIFSGLQVTDFSINEVFYGDAEFKTRWLQAEKAIAIDLNIFSKGTMDDHYKILGVNGIYYPFDEKRNFDFDISAQNLNISVLEPLLTSFSSHISGLATGKLTLDGTNAKPLLLGRLKLQRAEMLVDYINVLYSFSNEVNFTEKAIQFSDIEIYDPNSHTATITGGLYHDYFKNMRLDLVIKPDNFLAMDLNRYQNEVFYGKAYATGTVRISGPFDNLAIVADVKTEKGSAVTIPINYSVDVSQNEFIIFTSEDDSTAGDRHRDNQIVGLRLDLAMNITREADIEIVLPGNIGNIRAKGDGTMRLGVDPNGYLTLNGSYVIQSGLFVFSLEQLVSRRFDILEGSKISWTGDLYDAEVSIIARYRLRTDLSGLGITLIDPDAASQKVIVNTDIRMSGNLFNPDLTFGITFPNLQEQTKTAVYAVLDTNDKGLMNQQAISLLVLGSFSSTGTGGSNLVNPAAIVSNTLSNMLSQISNDFNIGINYMPGDQMSAEQLEVALSTQLLDDRLIIDGNIDVTGANASSQKTSSIVGDINIEYKLTPEGRFRVKAFNRSNDLSLFNDYAPYTQGVGIFYRKEFTNIHDIFRKTGPPKEKKVDKK
jgi:hypothetical protein